MSQREDLRTVLKARQMVAELNVRKVAKKEEEEAFETGREPHYTSDRSFMSKVVLLGESKVGKMSLSKRFSQSNFDDKYRKTMGVKVSKRQLELSMNDGYRAYVTMMVWDITSEPGPHSLVVEASLKGARGALLIGDATRPETIDRLEQWYKRIEDPKDIEVVYMANKIDAATDRTAINQRLKAVAGKQPYYTVSAKTGEYVETAVNKLAELLATRPSD